MKPERCQPTRERRRDLIVHYWSARWRGSACSMGEWGKFTGYKKASRLPAGFLLIPMVVGEASYGRIKYPK